MADYKPCLIDRNKIPFKALWIEADSFADDIVCAVGTLHAENAEAEHRVICDLLNRLQQMEVVDAEPVVRCKDCKNFRKNEENDTYCSSVNGLTDPEEDDFCSYGERKEE